MAILIEEIVEALSSSIPPIELRTHTLLEIGEVDFSNLETFCDDVTASHIFLAVSMRPRDLSFALLV